MNEKSYINEEDLWDRKLIANEGYRDINQREGWGGISGDWGG